MKFYTCGCLFDCYAYLCNVKSKEQIVTILPNRPQKNVAVFGKRFIFCDQIFCVETCHICLLLLLKVKKFNGDRINETLRECCWIYLGDSTISRVKGHTKTCFGMLQAYECCDSDKAVSVCCLSCLRFLVCHELIFDFFIV